MARDMRDSSSALYLALRSLSQEPSPDRQRATQAVLRRTMLAWKQAYPFRAGPFVSSEAFPRAAFWPARASSIDAILKATDPIDERLVEGLGVDARGLFALEYLLFEVQNAELAAVRNDDHGARVRSYALELGANVRGYADRVQRLLGDGRGYAADFARDGQRSVAALVTQTRDTLDVVSGKFARLERAAREGLPLPFAVEGYFSGSSLEIVLAILAGTEALYSGRGRGGLSELVMSVSSPIDAHVRDSFREAERRVRAMGAPLEVALGTQPERFRSAVEALSELRHVVDVELHGALVG